MKKLLSLLSVLTINGTAVPTTIAASPYQKEETIKNNDINYLQINNLDKLNRTKRNNIKFNVNGQITFDIGSIYTTKNIRIRRNHSSWGITGNNPPSDWEIISALHSINRYNSSIIKNQDASYSEDILNVSNAYKYCAYISAKPNTPFTGGFWVYYGYM